MINMQLDAFRTSKVQALLVYLATEDAIAATETVAALAPEAIAAARARGGTPDWWEAADALVIELQELGQGEA